MNFDRQIDLRMIFYRPEMVRLRRMPRGTRETSVTANYGNGQPCPTRPPARRLMPETDVRLQEVQESFSQGYDRVRRKVCANT